MLRTETEQPAFYQLQPKQQAVACEHSFERGLRVWDLATSAPFNRTRMAVEDSQGEIVFSRETQWAEVPGVMVAEVLHRDLSQAEFFHPVIYGMPSVDTAFELNGRVHVFGCERSQDDSRAVLKVELRLIHLEENSEAVVHKTYTLRSAPFAPNKPSDFVRSMNHLVRKLSVQFQQDLCQAAASFSRD